MRIESIRTVRLSRQMIKDCDDFLTFIDTRRFQRGLRNLMMYHLIHEKDDLPEYEFLEDLQFTFDFLDRIHDQLTEEGT